jgi:hypothetical protein
MGMMLRCRLLLFDLVHQSGASAVVRETGYDCFSMSIWKSNHADSCIPWRSRPVSSAAVLLKEILPNAMAASVYDSPVRVWMNIICIKPSRVINSKVANPALREVVATKQVQSASARWREVVVDLISKFLWAPEVLTQASYACALSLTLIQTQDNDMDKSFPLLLVCGVVLSIVQRPKEHGSGYAEMWGHF